MLVLAAVTFAAWLYLALGHSRFWLITPTLLPAGEGPFPPVHVVVPARDEEEMLGRTLNTLAAQDFPGEVRLTVVSDRSADRTVEVARAVPGVDVVEGSPTPDGWAGKVWALQQGLDRRRPDAAYILFTDADIAHPPDSLRRLVTTALTTGSDTVSVMARLRCRSTAEHWLIPAFVYFFAQLYPFRRVCSRRWPTTAAAGGCLLVRADALPPDGLTGMRDALIDDIAVARLVRAGGGQTWLGHTSDVLSLREYPRWADIWSMVTRSAWVQLRRSWLLLAGTVLGLAVVYLAPVVCVVAGHGTARWLGLAAWVLMAVTYVRVSRHYDRPASSGVALPLVALAYLAMTVDSARRGGTAWKGRPPVR